MKINEEEYIIDEEENKYAKEGYIWLTAIGLQKVDGLETSAYLKDLSKQNEEGKVSFDEIKSLVNSYYESKPNETSSYEADLVSIRIAQLLNNNSFSLSPLTFLSIHKTLFEGIYEHAGKIREYNITKKEWVLNDDSVTYGDYLDIRNTLEFDIQNEKQFSYRDLSIEQFIKHFSSFVSNLWQNHVFGEGNTRTTAVFIIKYLKSLGFDVSNDMFKDNSWYFRNALVRANYTNIKKGIYSTNGYLELFFRNLLLNEHHKLSNSSLLVSSPERQLTTNIKDKEILLLIKDNPKITIEEIAKKTSRSVRTISYSISRLKKEGLIQRKESKKNGYWEI